MKKAMFMVIISLFVFAGVAVAADPITLKYAIKNPLTSPTMSGAYVPMCKAIEGASKGSLKIEIFAGGSLGRDPSQLFKHLRNGVADIVHIYTPNYPGLFPDATVFNMPFMIENSVEGSIAAYNMATKGLMRGYDDFVLLTHVTNSTMRICSNFPIRVPKDLKGKKIRASGSFQVELFKAVGAVPVSMRTEKVAENISRGLLQASLQDLSAAATFRINDVTNWYLMIPFGPVGIAEMMYRPAYDRLPRDAQIAITRFAGRPYGVGVAQVMDDHSDVEEQRARKGGKITVYTPNAEEMKKWKDAFQSTVDKWLNKDPRNPNLYKELQKQLKWIRAGNFTQMP